MLAMTAAKRIARKSVKNTITASRARATGVLPLNKNNAATTTEKILIRYYYYNNAEK